MGRRGNGEDEKALFLGSIIGLCEEGRGIEKDRIKTKFLVYS